MTGSAYGYHFTKLLIIRTTIALEDSEADLSIKGPFLLRISQDKSCLHSFKAGLRLVSMCSDKFVLIYVHI